MILSSRHELLTTAACELIAHSICRTDIEATPGSSKAPWRNIIDFAFKSPNATVQEAVANAMVSISRLVNCSGDVTRYVDLSLPSLSLWRTYYRAITLIREGRSGPPPTQQNVCRVLGVLDYSAHAHGIISAIDFLLSSVDRSVS